MECQVKLIMYRTQVVQFIGAVRGADAANGACQTAHHKGISSDVIAVVSYALKQFAIGNACRGKEHILLRDQVIHRQYFFKVITRFTSAAQFILVTREKFALNLAAHCPQGTGGDHAFGGTANTKQNIHT